MLRTGVERIATEAKRLAELYDVREWWAARDLCVELWERCRQVMLARWGVEL